MSTLKPEKNDIYMIFNYITKCFSGSLLEDAPEGKPIWVHINKLPSLPCKVL